MKLNRKGYMLVEIVIAAVLAMGIAYYLLNLTYKFKNMDEDIYHSITYMLDKNLITKNIMNDIERGIISGVRTSESENKYEITFSLAMIGEAEQRKLKIEKNGGITSVEYGKIVDGVFDVMDLSYYNKELEDSLVVPFDKIEISYTDNAFSVFIPIQSMYMDETYNIIIMSPSYNFNEFLLSEVQVGSFVKYEGNNGCVEGHCDGTNANYESGVSNGYCKDTSYEFNSNGWRVANIDDNGAYLISAGAPVCMCSYSGSYNISSNVGCDYYVYDATGTIFQLNEIALSYCNSDYVRGGVCDINTVSVLDSYDVATILNVGSGWLSECSSSRNCVVDNTIINNGGLYWFGASDGSGSMLFWDSVNRYVNVTNDMYQMLGVRPVIAMDSNVFVIGGSGTEDDPYIIEKR